MAFRKDVSEMNWDDDGTNTSQGYGFLSESKIKSQLAPALVKNDLGMITSYSDLRALEPIGSMKQHFTVRIEVTIFDPYTLCGIIGEKCITFHAYGEGANSGDKAVSIAQTNALKNALANNLLFATATSSAESMMETKASDSVNQDPGVAGVKKAAKETLVTTNPPVQAHPQTSQARGINGIQASAMEKLMSRLRTTPEKELMQSVGFPLDYIEAEFKDVKGSNDSKKAALFIQKYKVMV